MSCPQAFSYSRVAVLRENSNVDTIHPPLAVVARGRKIAAVGTIDETAGRRLSKSFVHVTAFVLLAAWAGAARGTTYYVRTDGNDRNRGTEDSARGAWRTLQRAADWAGPGDSVLVRPGTYGAGMNFFGKKGGAPGRPLTVSADAGVVLTHCATSGVNAKLAGINIENTGPGIIIEGFRVVSDGSMERACIRVTGSDNHVIRRNECAGGFIGIFCSQSKGTEISDDDCHHSTDQHGIYCSAGTSGLVIRHNLLHDNHWDGLHLNSSKASGPNDKALVERNTCYANQLSGMDVEGCTHATFRNNLIFGNEKHGMTFHSADQAGTEPCSGNTIVNNTVVCSNTNLCFAVQFRPEDTEGTVLFNNVLLSTEASNCGSINTFSAESAAKLTSDYNVVSDRFSLRGGEKMARAAWQGQTGHDRHSVVAAAAATFADVARNDFRLRPGAPARKLGVASLAGHSAPPDDLDGARRDAVFDAGAYAFKPARK